MLVNFALIGFIVGFGGCAKCSTCSTSAGPVAGAGAGLGHRRHRLVVRHLAKLAATGALIRYLAGMICGPRWRTAREFRARAQVLAINRDRPPVVLMVAIAMLTRLGAERGAVTLAANGIVYQLFSRRTAVDGENAAHCGERAGDGDRAGFTALVRAILWRCLGVAILLSAASSALITDIRGDARGRRRSAHAVAVDRGDPAGGFAGFVLDGVFVPPTRALLLSMAGAALGYGVLLWLTWPLGQRAAGQLHPLIALRADQSLTAVAAPRNPCLRGACGVC